MSRWEGRRVERALLLDGGGGEGCAGWNLCKRNHFRTGKQCWKRSYTGKGNPCEMNWGWCDCRERFTAESTWGLSVLVSLIHLEWYRVKTYAKTRTIETGSKSGRFKM